MKSGLIFKAISSLIAFTTLCSFSKPTNSVGSSSNTNASSLSVNNYEVNSESTLSDDLTVTLTSYTRTTVSHSIQFRVALGNSEANYYIGYYEDGNNYTAKLEYDVYNEKNAFLGTYSTSIVQKSNHGIGSYLGSTSFIGYCDIELSGTYKIDTSSVKLIDCYKADLKFDDSGLLISRAPILDKPVCFETSEAKSFVSRDLSDFLDLEFKSFAEYEDYLAITVKTTNYGKELYSNGALGDVALSLYTKNKDNIENGTIKIRTRISLGGDSYLKVVNSNNEEVVIKTTTGDLKYFNDENESVFILEQFKAKDIKSFRIHAASVSVELFNTTTSKIVARSTVTTRFAIFDFKMQDVLDNSGNIVVNKVSTSKVTNYNKIFVIFTIALLVIYAVVAYIYYLHLKNKDKKSEFKVLNKKQFIKVNTLGVIFLEALLVDILYIFARSTGFNNSLTVFNPLDSIIFVASVICICLGGYFIKYYYNSYKSYKEKKARERLHLNAETSDDGTN